MRRREYYYKRVKPEFAPSHQQSNQQEEFHEDSLDETSPDSPGIKRKKNHRQLRNLSPKREWNPLFYCSVEMGGPKKQYVKMSDRVVQISKQIESQNSIDAKAKIDAQVRKSRSTNQMKNANLA